MILVMMLQETQLLYFALMLSAQKYLDSQESGGKSSTPGKVKGFFQVRECFKTRIVFAPSLFGTYAKTYASLLENCWGNVENVKEFFQIWSE